MVTGPLMFLKNLYLLKAVIVGMQMQQIAKEDVLLVRCSLGKVV